jgi:hypothetical protein
MAGVHMPGVHVSGGVAEAVRPDVWQNQQQWSPEQGDPYANGEFTGNDDFGYGIEASLTGGRFPVYGPPAPSHGSHRPGNLGSTAANAATVPPRESGSHFDFTQGRMVPNNRADGAQFGGRAQNLALMAYQAQLQPTNALQGDEGPTRFYGGGMGIDELGGLSESAGDRNLGYRRPTHILINSPAGIRDYNNSIAGPSNQLPVVPPLSYIPAPPFGPPMAGGNPPLMQPPFGPPQAGGNPPLMRPPNQVRPGQIVRPVGPIRG